LSEVVERNVDALIPNLTLIETEVTVVMAFPPGPPRTWEFARAHNITSDALSKLMEIQLEPQEEGGFVAFSREYLGAVGQGETEEEAIKDLQEAIQLLKEVLEEEIK
jgi:predicted RNase H-like HicB family nuclease